MAISVRESLMDTVGSPRFLAYLSDVSLEPEQIKTVMINEAVPLDPVEDFYGSAPAPAYLETVFPLFREAGCEISRIEELLHMGIYLTNAVKFPKRDTTVPKELLEESLPVLEMELGLFPNLRTVMLMGDVAKKAFNAIAKRKTGKAAVPSGSTYKLRSQEFWYCGIRVFPSYIMTGKNILIEKSKFQMAADDIRRMLQMNEGKGIA